MFAKYLKFSGLVVISSLAFFGLFVGCKNAGNPLDHQGPFDVPNSTITATPTVTSTPGPVNVSCYVNYNGSQSISWNLVDPNGNTVNPSAQSSGGTPFLFTPSVYGTYSVNIPTQTNYLYSSQPLTITGAGNYSVTFTCSGQILSTNPTSFNYSSAVGYQTPVTVSYSYSGNLDVPVSVQTSGLDSSFSVSPSNLILNNSGSSAPLTISKNSCDFNNTSLNLNAYGLLGSGSVAASNVPINKGYSIPVSLVYSTSNGSQTFPSGELNGSVTVQYNIYDNNLACGTTPYQLVVGTAFSNPQPQFTNFNGGGTFNIGSLVGVRVIYTYSYELGSGPGVCPVTLNLPNGSQVSGAITIITQSGLVSNVSSGLELNTSY